MDHNFLFTIDYLFKIDETKQEKLKRIKKLEDDIFSCNNLYLALRLAYEKEHNNYSTTRIENFIAKSGNARIIYRFAYGIDKANIKKLQNAIIKTNDIEEIARFGCFIPGADKEKIGDIIAKSNNAKATYLYLCFARIYPYEKLKHIIFASKRPRYLFQLAKLTKDENELKLIEELIFKSKSLMYCRLWCRYYSQADIHRFEDKIIKSKNRKEIQLFAKEIPSAQKAQMMVLLF